MHKQPKQPNTENAITVTDIKELMFILLKVIIIFHKGLKSLVNNKKLAKLKYMNMKLNNI